MQVIKCDHCDGIMDVTNNEYYQISVLVSDEGDHRLTSRRGVHLCADCYSFVDKWLVHDTVTWLHEVETSDKQAEHHENHDTFMEEE